MTSKPKIETIIDDEGKAWTGPVTHEDSGHAASDNVAAVLTMGVLSPLFIESPREPSTTVEVNNVQHTGTPISGSR